jgi:hypothetical protein
MAATMIISSALRVCDSIEDSRFFRAQIVCFQRRNFRKIKKVTSSQGNALCLECHGTNAKPEALKDEHLVTIFNVRCVCRKTTSARLSGCLRSMDWGDPVDRHPVTDWGDKPVVLAG